MDWRRLDHVFKLTHSAGKGMLLQEKNRILGETADRQAVSCAEQLQEVLCQRDDVRIGERPAAAALSLIPSPENRGPAGTPPPPPPLLPYNSSTNPPPPL